MKCNDVEKMIIHSPEKEFSPEELWILENHLSECDRCAHLKEDMKAVRLGIKRWALPGPSDELVQQTRVMCHEELNAQVERKALLIKSPFVAKISGPAWMVLVSLIVLTFIWIMPLIKEFDLSLPLKAKTSAVLAIMIQNGIMLFFAPLLIRRYRLKNFQFRII